MDTTTSNVTGNVFDVREKLVLEGAVVTLMNQQYTYRQASNGEGNFDFSHVVSGKYEVSSRFLGYYTFKDSIQLEPGDIVNIKIGHITDW
ncbi:hypothetical protein BFP97_03700 [Roseivirga sp. 4D4]|uniref:carboxypeptidase-like regulatory domain-containing protein n=1 Tax=Roseivirga sp. 4D4 TaxID=1889784 RepID=UPI000852DFC2|nr:carboxypeptidase-like regulatory domain-containing protein [Roseivirga sp. 4D4]OEK00663.1 hypothetical protein BFP97_03700 [Roseivirga sp. 4D4]